VTLGRQLPHMFLAEQRLTDTPQAEERDVVWPAALEVCGRLGQDAQLVHAVGEDCEGRTGSPVAHAVTPSVI